MDMLDDHTEMATYSGLYRGREHAQHALVVNYCDCALHYQHAIIPVDNEVLTVKETSKLQLPPLNVRTQLIQQLMTKKSRNIGLYMCMQVFMILDIHRAALHSCFKKSDRMKFWEGYREM